MTNKNKEAIKWLKTFKGRYGITELENAVDTAINALEREQGINTLIEEIEDIDPVTERVGVLVKEDIINIIKEYFGVNE